MCESWYSTYNSTFWLSLAGILAGVIGVGFAAVNKSKCSSFLCCFGLFSCVRDTKGEIELEEHQGVRRAPSTPQMLTVNV
jgi:hypothetical protein